MVENGIHPPDQMPLEHSIDYLGPIFELKKAGRLDEAVEVAREQIESLGPIFELRKAGRLDEAVEVARELISMHPDYPLLNYELGELLYDLGDYEEACGAFKRELEVTPRFRDAACELGSTYSRLGRTEDAVAAYQHALDIDPCCIAALYGIGNACMRNGDYDEAVEYYEDALFLQPELDRSSLMASERSATELLIALYYNMGVASMMARNLEKAQESFGAVQRIKPEGILADLAGQNLRLLSDPNSQPNAILPNEDLSE